MATATIKLIEAVERMEPGSMPAANVDAMHELATLARLEQVEIAEATAMKIAAIKPHVERAERFKKRTGGEVSGARIFEREGAEGFQPPVSTERPEQYVIDFLRAVGLNPGGKNPVASYYPAGTDELPENAPMPRASWEIAEQKGWVTCLGSHKWRCTAEGFRIIGDHDRKVVYGDKRIAEREGAEGFRRYAVGKIIERKTP